jgi:hypothetical protein
MTRMVGFGLVCDWQLGKLYWAPKERIASHAALVTGLVPTTEAGRIEANQR